MNWILFRTFPKDDYICRLAFESFKLAGIDGNYIFLAEHGKYKYLEETNGTFYFRDSGAHSNYGGQLGVKCLLKSFKNIEIKDNDIVYLSDSDIVLFEKIIPDSDLEGFGGQQIINHISGQLQIMSSRLFNLLKSFTEEEINNIVFNEMIPMGLNVADDTFNSYIAHKYEYSVKFHENKWLHDKLYKHDGDTEYKKIIENVCNL